MWSLGPRPASAWVVLWLAGSGVLVQLARSALDFVVTDVLGDVQVYTTHDTTANDFKTRTDVIETVTAAILGVLNSDVPYRRIHIAAHSLGSTISLDVLMRIKMMAESSGAIRHAANKVRTFVTFGTSLEKTRFLLDVNHPTRSAAHDQWDADVFGRFFTAESTVLDKVAGGGVIYWRNVHYWNDIVANKIRSYTSDVSPGAPFDSWISQTGDPRLLADNVHLNPGFWLRFTHVVYLKDFRFWLDVGPVLTS